MTTDFPISSADGTYYSPTGFFRPENTTNTTHVISFEFYDDEECTEVSTGMTGELTINGRMSPNGVWQNIPDTNNPSTVDISDAKSLSFVGVIQSLQIITDTITNTNFIKIIIN